MFLKLDEQKILNHPFANPTLNSKSPFPYSCFYWIGLHLENISHGTDSLNLLSSIASSWTNSLKKTAGMDLSVKLLEIGNLPELETFNGFPEEDIVIEEKVSVASSSNLKQKGPDPDITIKDLHPTNGNPAPEVEENVQNFTESPANGEIFSLEDALQDIQPVDKSVKMRTSIEVYNRIRWDKAFHGGADFVIGFEDRFDGVIESAFNEFDTESIPFHRIRYFKYKGTIVYDRVVRIDILFTHRKKKAVVQEPDKKKSKQKQVEVTEPSTATAKKPNKKKK